MTYAHHAVEKHVHDGVTKHTFLIYNTYFYTDEADMGYKEFILGFIAPVPFYFFGYVAKIGIKSNKMEFMIAFMLIGSIVTIMVLSMSGYMTMPNGLSQRRVTVLAKQVTSGIIFVLFAVSLGLLGPASVLFSPVILSTLSTITSAMCLLMVAFSIKHAVFACATPGQTLQV